MELDIDELEEKLIARYGKESWEKRLNNFYLRSYPQHTDKHNKNFESARRTLILGLSKFIAEATPSKIIKD